MAAFFFESFAYLYNKYVVRRGWDVSAVNMIANSAIRDAFQYLTYNGYGVTLDLLTYLAADNFYKTLGRMSCPLSRPPDC
jgi:hypothetical protein